MKYIFLLILAAMLLTSCATVSNIETASTTCGTTACISGSNATNAVEKVEIYHFHGTQQCNSCKAVGAYAEETVNLFFADEVRSGKVVFQSINYELPENKKLAAKYGVGGSSLWIGVYDSQGFHPEQNTDVWLKINNKDDYMFYLKGVIEQKLSGK